MMKPSNTYPRTNRLAHQLQQETAAEEERLDISPRMRRHGSSLTMNSNLFRHLRHNSPFNLPLYGDDNGNSSNSVLSNDRFMAILDEAIAISDEHCRRSRGLTQFSSSQNIGEEGQEDQDNSTTKKQ